MVAADQVSGLLLCRVGPHRLAFPAGQVLSIESSLPGTAFPHARSAFDLQAEPGRVLLTEAGEAVTVDSLEVHPDQVTLMPAPRMLAAGAGGSLRGFVAVRDQLWPLHNLIGFARYLTHREPA